jgi:hypothetical protein
MLFETDYLHDKIDDLKVLKYKLLAIIVTFYIRNQDFRNIISRFEFRFSVLFRVLLNK